MLLQLARHCSAIVPGRSPFDLAPLDAALLAWLALEGPTPRARLAALLWPDSDAEAARNTLRQRLFQLKRQLGAELVTGSATLALADGVQHDLEDSDSVLGHAAHDHSPEFGTWLAQQRERRVARVRQSLLELCAMAEQAKDFDDALAHARELLALEPLGEEAHRRLMRLHYQAGDRAAALLAFDRCEQVLKDEVGAKPSAETLALLATIEASARDAALPMRQPVPASVLRPPRMVGRERELAQLAQGWHAGEVVALIGEAGMGKSRLLQEFGAARPGVVMAAGRPGDAGVPFATLARLLRAVMALDAAGPLALAAEPQRRALARVLPELDVAMPREPGEGQRLLLQRALGDVLSARRGLQGLVVDDLHFADEASLEMLAALIDQGGASLRWTLAYRPAEAGSPARALHDGLVEQARLVPVTLQPLDAAQLAELVDSLALPGVAGSVLAAGLLRRTGGNPLFVLETLKQAWVDDALAELADARQLPRPLAVGRLIERRVAMLSPGALALARAAAVAGVDFDIALAEHVLGASALQFADALNELEAAQVMRGPQFAHDLVFDAVLGSVPQAIARHLHARIAGWLEQHGGEPARVARHWIDAAQPAQALPWLARAAAAAGAAVRRKEQVAFLETKAAIEHRLAEGGDAAARAAAFETTLQAVQLSVTIDDGGSRGRMLCERLARLAATAPERARAKVQLAHLSTMRGQLEQAEAMAREALREATRDEVDAALVAECRCQLGTVLCTQDRSAEALPHLESSLAWVDAHGDVETRCELHGNLASTYDGLGRVADAALHHEQAIALARAYQHHGNETMCLANLAANRLRAGRVREAQALLAQARLLRQRDPDGSSLDGFIALNQAIADYQSGRYRDALSALDATDAALAAFAPGFAAAVAGHRAVMWAGLGQWARVQQHLDDAGVAADTAPLTVCRRALLQAWLARALDRGRPGGGLEAALAALGPTEGPDMRHALHLELAAWADTQAPLDTLQAVLTEAGRLGLEGMALAARGALARLLAHRGRRDEALAQLEVLERLDRVPLHTLVPLRLYPLQPWHDAVRALLCLGDHARAKPLAAALARWIDDTARQQVPEEFRDSFRHRNPVNRDLLALHARLARD